MNSRKRTTTNTQELEADLVIYFPRINKDIFVVASDKVTETLNQAGAEGVLPVSVVDSVKQHRNSGAIPANHNQVLTLDKSNASLVIMPKGACLARFKSAYDIMMSCNGAKSTQKGFGK
jgi:secreted protein with Ig-like and vWFA domain